MDPFAVRTFVEALDRPRVDGPHPVERGIWVLDTLPIQARCGQCALQQRGGHALARPLICRACSAAAIPSVAK